MATADNGLLSPSLFMGGIRAILPVLRLCLLNLGAVFLPAARTQEDECACIRKQPQHTCI